MRVVLWKLYLRGRMNEYKLLGFIWSRADILPATVRHGNICCDIVKDTSQTDATWARPKKWPNGS